MTVRIGTSGWAYPEWRGGYYPKGLPQRGQLEYLAGRLSTVELNGSFYRLQRPAGYRSWYERTPAHFVFAVKGHRFVTHVRRLKDPAEPLANFLGSGVLELGNKLGPLLWQLPPGLRFDPPLVRDFLTALDTATAATGRSLRHAIEVRDPTFRDQRFYDLLAEHNVALVRADTAGRWPYIEQDTADFTYARLHGATELYVSDYDATEVASWADKVRTWTEQGDVYLYFDNTAFGAAPWNAELLAELDRACRGSGVAGPSRSDVDQRSTTSR
jgi:uncharacterized protein YecE (DUF72 family)